MRRISGPNWHEIAPPFAGTVRLSSAIVAPIVAPPTDTAAGPVIAVFHCNPGVNTQIANTALAMFSLSRTPLYFRCACPINLRAAVFDSNTYDVTADVLDNNAPDAAWQATTSTLMWLDYPLIAPDGVVPIPPACSHIWYQRTDSSGTLDIVYPNGAVRTIPPNLGYGVPRGGALHVIVRLRSASVLFQIGL